MFECSVDFFLPLGGFSVLVPLFCGFFWGLGLWIVGVVGCGGWDEDDCSLWGLIYGVWGERDGWGEGEVFWVWRFCFFFRAVDTGRGLSDWEFWSLVWGDRSIFCILGLLVGGCWESGMVFFG